VQCSSRYLTPAMPPAAGQLRTACTHQHAHTTPQPHMPCSAADTLYLLFSPAAAALPPRGKGNMGTGARHGRSTHMPSSL
jgi:hypothetical protein